MTASAAELSLVGRLRFRAERDPDGVAFRFLDLEGRETIETYAGLDRSARSLAVRLTELARPGDRIVLLFPAGLEFPRAFLGCLYAGLLAVPAPPPEVGRERRTLPRLEGIVVDAQPVAVLSSKVVIDGLAGEIEASPCLRSVRWLAVDDIEESDASSWREPSLLPETLAYLQYTSGSTSIPKGVMVPHAALQRSSELIRRAWGYGPDCTSVMWVPNFHDDGLVHGIVQPIYSGFPAVLMPPLSITKPILWLAAIDRFRATHAGGPNFAYALAVRKIGEAERRGLNLTSWRVAYNAAEPIRRETLADFVTAFEPSGFGWYAFFPSFGLAEATLLVTTRRERDLPAFCWLSAASLETAGKVVAVAEGVEGSRAIVGCGHPVDGVELAIVDPDSRRPRDPGEVGEVWVRDTCVAAGYWRRGEDSTDTFEAHTADGGGPFLRTGDLGFLLDGQLFVTGRLKDLIILHGRNLSPQDLEITVERCHPAMRPGCCAAFSVEIEGAERLVVVQEVISIDEELHGEVLLSARRALSEEHDLAPWGIVLIRPQTLPKTSSGKVQRQSCRRDYLADKLDVVSAWTASRSTAEGAEPASLEEKGSSAQDLLVWLRELAAGQVNSRLIDERRSISPGLVLELGNRGLLGLQAPRVYGGLGLGHRDSTRIYSQLAAIDLTLASFVSGHNALGLTPLLRSATRELQEELLPSLVSGRSLAAFALSEPGAGSNPRAIEARAETDGPDRYRLYGHKAWSGTASWARVIHVFVRSGKDAGGVNAFAVRSPSAGLSFGPEAMTMGLRGMVQSSVLLDGVVVDRRFLLGQEGAGLDVAQDAMTLARLYLGAMAVGGMKRCSQQMLRYARSRRISTGRLLDNPVSLARLSDLTAATAALEALVDRAAARLDLGHPPSIDASLVCKIAGSELLWWAVDSLVQMLGGRGYLEPNLAAQMLRDARVFRIVEGPTETLEMFLGTRALHEPTELEQLLTDVLGAPQVGTRLREVLARLDERRRGTDAPFGNRRDSLQWHCSCAGRLVTAAALWAAAVGATPGLTSRVIAWAEQRFETLAEEVLGLVGLSSWAGVGDLESAIDAYQRDIGEVEQTAAGEDNEPDSALRTILQSRPAIETVQLERQPVSSRPRETLIADWIASWVARQLSVPSASLDRRRPFSFHGLDSVTSVLLLDELGEWLGHRVAPTLAWAHPSIEELSRHLAKVEAGSRN